ncbi:hypothetical protein V866_006435 [Kwoniella sp. B9012]
MATIVKERNVAQSKKLSPTVRPSFRDPPPSKFAPCVPEDPAIQVLHQLCAFEQVLYEVIAEKDGLKISPIKASLRVELDFDDIIKPFLVKVCATDTQLKKKDNIVPEHWIEKSFLSFVSIGSLHLQSCPEIEGQIGLYQQNALPTETLRLKDLQFVVFSFPEEIDDISEAEFEEGLTFEHEVDGREITLIGLGPARTINHSCEPNVYWELETETLDYLPDGSLPNIGFTCLPIDKVEGKFIDRGQQLTAFYSDYFAENLCDCKYPTYHQQGKRADSSSDSEYEPEDSEDETKSSTNPFIRLKTKSKMEVKRRSPRLPACKKVAGHSARTTQIILPHKATRKPKASKAETTSLNSNHNQVNQQSFKPAVQENANKNCDLTRSSLSFHKTSPPGTTQDSHLPESKSTEISPLRDAFDLFSNISEEQYPITSTSIPMSNATPLLQAFLNSQKIVMNQQELFKAQLKNPKVTEAMIRKTQGMLARYQDTQDRLRKMLWGERLN